MGEHAYPYVWTHRYRPPGRKGWRCRIVRTRAGTPNTVGIEFQRDGASFIVDKRGLARAGA